MSRPHLAYNPAKFDTYYMDRLVRIIHYNKQRARIEKRRYTIGEADESLGLALIAHGCPGFSRYLPRPLPLP